MKYIFKNNYHRKTVDSGKVLVYILLAFMLGMLTTGVFIGAYNAFRGINKQEPLLSPLSGIELIKPVYANGVKKEDSWLEAMYQTIRWNESNDGTKGLAVTCTKKGKINETGFRAHQKFCFNSLEQQEIETKQWLSEKIVIKGMTKFQAMRLYTNNGSYSYLFKK